MQICGCQKKTLYKRIHQCSCKWSKLYKCACHLEISAAISYRPSCDEHTCYTGVYEHVVDCCSNVLLRLFLRKENKECQLL